MFNIEKNIPFSVADKSKYPWDQMEIGDSFVVDANGRCLKSLRSSLISAAKKNSNVHHGGKRKYKTRTVGDGSAIRIWRVE